MNFPSTSLAQAFGNVIRRERVKAGWSQEELSRRAGVHRTYVGDLENGRKSPTLDVLEALAKAFGRPAHELISTAESILAGSNAPFLQEDGK